MIKLRRMRLADHVGRVEEMSNEYTVHLKGREET
jgi:hypothetical protein